MSGISLMISTVEAKIERLIRHGETLKSQLKYQESRYQELASEVSEKNKKIALLEEQISKLQTVAAAPLGDVAQGKQDAKLRINELVREIDKCIALLNR